MVGVLEPVGLGDQHPLHLIPPGLQVLEGDLLGRRRHIETQIVGPETVKCEHPGVDRIGLGEQAHVFGEVPHARAMRLVHRKPEFHTDFEHMALVAAGGFADDQQGPKVGFPVAPHLPHQQLAHRFGLVGDGALPIAGQAVDDQCLFGDLERNDVVECDVSRAHSHGAGSVILDCMRPC